MGFRTALPRLIALAFVLAALAMAGAGCGAPKHRAEDFVGKWRVEGSPASDFLLELDANGLGTNRLWHRPYGMLIRWSVVGSDLMIESEDGTRSANYSYSFDTPNGMTLTIGGKEYLLVKVK